MRIKWTGCLWATAFLSLAGCQGEIPSNDSEASLGTQTARASSPCVEQFDGIKSCALGKARLAPTSEGLEVTGLGTPDTDGVASHFDKAVKWSQRVAIENFDTFNLDARDGTQVVSSLQVAYSKDENAFTITPVFTGSTHPSYTVNVYRQDQLVSTSNPTINRWIRIKGEWIYISWTAWDFWQVVPNPSNPNPGNVGACGWSASSVQGKTFTAEIDGKDVVGDTIEFVENIDDGAYPYNEFTGIDVRGTATRYTVLTESVTQR